MSIFCSMMCLNARLNVLYRSASPPDTGMSFVGSRACCCCFKILRWGFAFSSDQNEPLWALISRAGRHIFRQIQLTNFLTNIVGWGHTLLITQTAGQSNILLKGLLTLFSMQSRNCIASMITYFQLNQQDHNVISLCSHSKCRFVIKLCISNQDKLELKIDYEIVWINDFNCLNRGSYAS